MQIITIEDLIQVDSQELDQYFHKTEWLESAVYSQDSLLEIDMTHFKRISDPEFESSSSSSSPSSCFINSYESDSFQSDEISERPSKKLKPNDQEYVVSLSAPVSELTWQRVKNQPNRPRILRRTLTRKQKADRDQLISSMNKYLTSELGWLTNQYGFSKTTTGYCVKRKCRHPKCPTSFTMTVNVAESNGLLASDIKCDHF